MKRKVVVYLVAITMKFLVGCHSTDLSPVLSSDKYTITSVILDSKSIPSSASLPEDLETILQSRQNEVTRMPTAYLNPGEKIEINQQKPITFAISFDQDGGVKEETTIGVGKRLEVAIDEEPPHQVSIYVEDMEITDWRRTTTTQNKTYRLPKTRKRSMGTNITPQIGTWQLMGKSDLCLFAFRIDPPLNEL